MRSSAAAAALVATLVTSTHAIAAGAALPVQGVSDPTLDVRVAVAIAPHRSTRWSEITIPAATRVMWLVPARPGAAVDWASDRWLAALDDATAVRIVPPSTSSPCGVPSSPERAPSWTTIGAPSAPAQVVVETTADAARAYARDRGYEVSTAMAARIDALYTRGWNLVAVELAAGSTSTSSGVLRVSDDGEPVLPLALTGSRTAVTHVTAFTIGGGVATMPGARDVDEGAITWGASGASFGTWRRDVVEGGMGATWLRESASHEALFGGYLGGASCASAAESAGASTGVVGTACAAGAAARVPGGAACAPSSGDVDASTFTCEAGLDDLSLALSGTTPAMEVVTRWSGVVAPGELGNDVGVGFDPTRAGPSAVVRAGSYDACSHQSTTTPLAPVGGGSPSGGSTTTSDVGSLYAASPGCSGAAVSSSSDDDGSDTEDDSSDGCGGSSSTSSSSSSSDSSSDDGWDESDDDSSDSCSSDDSSSASVDTNRARPTKRRSPVSRIALAGFALVLPLRRRRPGTSGAAISARRPR